MSKGHIRQCAKKLAEEAVEAALCAVSGTDEEVIVEVADVFARLNGVLKARDISFRAVEAELERRDGATDLAGLMRRKRKARKRRK